MDKTDKKVLHKSLMFLLVVVAVFVVIILVANKNGTEGPNENNMASVVSKQAIINIKGNNLVASVVDTAREREIGLSKQHALNDQMGMYFVFDEADTHSFWMKDMEFPIDIIWLNESNVIVHIEENVTPNTYPAAFKPEEPAKFVLEVAAGYAKRNNVAVGDSIIVTEVK